MSIFPGINAILNTISFLFLFLGWRAIKSGSRDIHKRRMLGALTATALFLTGYITYHFLIHGITHYQGKGALRALYFGILISHTILAVLIVPFVVAAVRLALKGNFRGHKKITRRLLPAWMYVSATGVIIYFMLYW